MKNLKTPNKEKGFSFLEVVLSLAIVSITMLVLLTSIQETNRMDILSKENTLTANLVDAHISYYRSISVTTENIAELKSDLSDVNLVDNYRKTLSDEQKKSAAIKMYQDLDVVCYNTPKVSGDNTYMTFTIHCEKDGKKMNKGKPFIIQKYINK